MSLTRVLIAAGAAALAAGCVSMPMGVPGKYLVYRDTNGNMIRQFDYPSEDICRKVEAVAWNSARCQPESLANQMQARATLRYAPPGILVQGHYPDVTRCQNDTRSLAAGVQLIDPCVAK
jgi:hypothetical protein